MFDRGKKDEPVRSQGPASRGVEETGVAPDAGRSDTGGPREGAVIGRSIHINGDLRGEEDLRIEGDVNGTIQLKNNSLTIGKDGKIRADVYAKNVTVDGLMEGDLYGSERVTIRKSARVLGNITAPRVSLEDGARFKGSIEMDPEAVDAAIGKSQPAAKAGQPSQPSHPSQPSQPSQHSGAAAAAPKPAAMSASKP